MQVDLQVTEMSRVWVINKTPEGLPKLTDFSLINEELPPCKDGDVIIKAEFWSVDPYMRSSIANMNINEPIIGSQVSRVIESKNEDFPVGVRIVGYPGWKDISHLTRTQLNEKSFVGAFQKIFDTGNYPISTALGVLGMPGATAYFGFLKICDPKPGETVLVNAAAGACGSIVCQLAKIHGCKVVAFVGSPKKAKWLKELGVNFVFNYKEISVSEGIKTAAPNGIDCYFDNVGGSFTAEAMHHMAPGARVAICGSISTYNEKSDFDMRKLQGEVKTGMLIYKQIKVEGFVCYKWVKEWPQAFIMLKQWMDEGKIKYKETVTKGFENLPKTFIGLFSGENIGKAIIQA